MVFQHMFATDIVLVLTLIATTSVATMADTVVHSAIFNSKN